MRHYSKSIPQVARPNVVDATPAPNLLQEHKENPYTMQKLLGRGSYGTVHLCTLRDDMTLKPYACKTVAKRNISSRSFILEVIILDQLSHSPNIGKFKEAFQDDASFHLITEFCEGGTLLEDENLKDHQRWMCILVLCHLLLLQADDMCEWLQYLWQENLNKRKARYLE